MTKAAPRRDFAVLYPAAGGEVVTHAAKVLAETLTVMLEGPIESRVGAEVPPGELWLTRSARRHRAAPPAFDHNATLDTFSITPAAHPGDDDPVVIRGGTERAVLHGAYALLEGLGASFPPGRPPTLPRIAATQLETVATRTVTPAFVRRALVSDIMTWHYEMPDRFAQHLEHDRRFIPWMAAQGLNAFSYIRHQRDSRLKIDEIAPLFRAHGIATEYGGHVLQLLLPRAQFAAHPDYFPADDTGTRSPRGNLCVSNRAALEIVCQGAVDYVRDNPEGRLLHIWGADVWNGAWCRCGECARLSPQQQYARVINSIADALANAGSNQPALAYLGYHDTLEPDPGLRPRPNVWFEWAPRERCYSHAIDDPACATNPRYLEALKRYLELFDGRGHIFEYYADAILFGGLGFATPEIIVRDLRAYLGLGITSISCLTFGGFSTLAYPVNLATFARATRSPAFAPAAMLADTAALLHPGCAREMTVAYRILARASRLILEGGGDVMRPAVASGGDPRRRHDLAQAIALMQQAEAAAEQIGASLKDELSTAERGIWRYSRKVLKGICEYLAAFAEHDPQRRIRGERAIKTIDDAVEYVRAIALPLKGTWGAYDLEWVREIWLTALRRRLGMDESPESAGA